MSHADIVPARPGIIEILLAGALLLALVVALQFHMGSYHAEFDYDESSHYISGLLIRDYVAAGLPGNPVGFLSRFHSSYPLVGIGHWGPVYYVVEAAWMLVFGPGRIAIILLAATATAAMALIIYALAAPRFGRILAAAAALAFVFCPIVMQASEALLLDIPIAFVCFMAMLVYGHYLRTGNPLWSLLFGLLAVGGLLIKGNAACLALLPGFVLLIGRDWSLLLRWSFWLPVPVVVVLAGPWYWFTYGQIAPGFRASWGWEFISMAVPANLQIMLAAVGPLTLLAGFAGFVLVCRRARSAPDGGFLVATASLFASVLVFQSVAPAAIQDRYLAPALPPLLLLAAYAITQGLQSWRGTQRQWQIAAVVLLAITAIPFASAVEPKRQFGMIGAAQAVWANRNPANPSVLIVAEGAGEGAAIAELAMLDPARPSLFAIRGSRLLGGGGYNTLDYEPRYHSPAEAMAAIDKYAIPLVILETRPQPGPWTHVKQVDDALALQPGRWKLLYQTQAGDAQVRVYQIQDNAAKTADRDALRALSAPRALTGD